VLTAVAATEQMVAGLLDGRYDLSLISLPGRSRILRLCPSSRRNWSCGRPGSAPLTTAIAEFLRGALVTDGRVV